MDILYHFTGNEVGSTQNNSGGGVKQEENEKNIKLLELFYEISSYWNFIFRSWNHFNC